MPMRAAVVIFAVPPVSSPGPTVTSDLRTAVAVIPARYHSTRLPGKALADIGGRPMIEHVYRRASDARTIAAVIVATDDARIADAVRSVRRRRAHDVSVASERNGSPGGDRADADERARRERTGGRATHRAGHDRRSGGAVCCRADAGDEHAATPPHRSGGSREPERDESRRRPRELCALLFTRADPLRASWQPGCARLGARRASTCTAAPAC